MPEPNGYSLRRFELVRTDDRTGVSGTGVVAVGVEFPNGYVEMQWLNDQNNRLNTNENGHSSYPGGVSDVIDIHGHENASTIRWLDPKVGES